MGKCFELALLVELKYADLNALITSILLISTVWLHLIKSDWLDLS